VRCAAESVACSRLPRPLLTERNQLFGCGDLRLQRGGIDGRQHDIGRERAPGRFELVGLLLNLTRQSAVGEVIDLGEAAGGLQDVRVAGRQRLALPPQYVFVFAPGLGEAPLRTQDVR